MSDKDKAFRAMRRAFAALDDDDDLITLVGRLATAAPHVAKAVRSALRACEKLTATDADDVVHAAMRMGRSE